MQKWGLPSNTKKFFNVIVALGFTLLVIWIFVISQTESSHNPQLTPQQQIKIDSLRKALGRTDTTQVETRDDSILDNATVVFILLGGALIAVWFWSRRQTGGSQDSLFTHIAQQDISTGQSIHVIEINNMYWFLGVTSNSVNLLEKMPKNDWDGPPLDTSSKPSDLPFTSMVKKFMNKNASE